jgi:hypothetical protein
VGGLFVVARLLPGFGGVLERVGSLLLKVGGNYHHSKGANLNWD